MTTFFVPGIPQQQGSKTAYVVGNRAVVADQNRARLKPWRAQVAASAAAAWTYGERLDGPIRLIATFVLPKPKSVRRQLPHVRPDADKLLRALMDGITDAGCVWGDDSQVCEIEASKVYGATPGVHVGIAPITTNP